MSRNVSRNVSGNLLCDHCEVPDLRARVQELEAKHAATCEVYRMDLEAESKLQTDLAIVRASADSVWFWQGSGDHPESLSCPVVMSAETLRSMLVREQELRKALGFDTPWPVIDVLIRLADAGDHLLHDHNCDMHGHEGILDAVEAARRIVLTLAGAVVTDDTFSTAHDAPVALPVCDPCHAIGALCSYHRATTPEPSASATAKCATCGFPYSHGCAECEARNGAASLSPDTNCMTVGDGSCISNQSCMHDAKSGPSAPAGEAEPWKLLVDLLESLPRCTAIGCASIATKAFIRGDHRWCDACAAKYQRDAVYGGDQGLTMPPDYPRAIHVRAAVAALAERKK